MLDSDASMPCSRCWAFIFAIVRGGTGGVELPGSTMIILSPGLTPSGQMTPIAFFPSSNKTRNNSPGATSSGKMTVRNVVGSGGKYGRGAVKEASFGVGAEDLAGPVSSSAAIFSEGKRDRDKVGTDDAAPCLSRSPASGGGFSSAEVGLSCDIVASVDISALAIFCFSRVTTFFSAGALLSVVLPSFDLVFGEIDIASPSPFLDIIELSFNTVFFGFDDPEVQLGQYQVSGRVLISTSTHSAW
mmetsp:Transcript_35140/g.74961  ORF Transcript_35140/g.74961 Transcript_35140/m.74961 type:complete len:244 (-) Transcript_35140:384-1115(-)